MEHRVRLVLFLLTVFQLGNHLIRAKESSNNGKRSNPAINSNGPSSEEETTPVDIDKWNFETSSTGNGKLLRSSFYRRSQGKEMKPKDTDGSGWGEDYQQEYSNEDEEEPEDMLDSVILAALRYKNSLKTKLRSWAEKAKSKLCSNKYLLAITKVSKFCRLQYGPIVFH